MERGRPGILIAVIILVLTACAGEKQPLSGSRPNIVLILADDLGFSDLGVHGNILVETPRLDQLAAESVQFSQFYVTPVCATTRASLLTGRHFLRTGVSHVHGGKDFLHLDEVTLADALQEQGYATGMWGKWHSGKTPGYYPWERGFDEAFMAGLYQHENNKGLFNGSEVATSGWVSEVITNYAIDFMKRHQDEPFFAYLPFLSCHAPLKAPEKYIQKYREKGLTENLSTLYGMVDQMDYHIGRLMDALEEMHLSENTIVLFLSDNGPAFNANALTDEDRKIRYVNGLRGHKGNIWENGIKSPLFVKWEGRIEAASVGRLSGVSDLFPTLLELAAAEGYEEPGNLDGRSIVPFLRGEVDDLPGREIFLYANPGWPPTGKAWTPEGIKDEYRPWKFSGGDNLSYEKQIIGIRNEQYKLLLNPGFTDGTISRDDSGYVFLDVKNDPRELANVLSEHPDMTKKMKESLHTWYEDIYHSEHAFEMPVFQVGQDTEKDYPVLAYAPRLTSQGVIGAFNYITGFTGLDDFSEYTIHVDRAGTYDWKIRYMLEGDQPMMFDLAFPDHNHKFELIPNNSVIDISGIKLSEGITRFRLLNKEARPGANLRLYSMSFSRQ